MKRIKAEQINTTVGHFLKRRQYMDTIESKRVCNKHQSLDELTLQVAVATNTSALNTFTFSSISGDATACDQQFNRFKAFVTDAVEPYRTQLRPLLFPVFVHAYLELLHNGQKALALKFFSRHKGFLQDSDKAKAMLDLLKDNQTEAQNKAPVTEFRENKFGISLTDDALQYLLRYLKTEESVLMLQIFNQHIDVRVRSPVEDESVDQREVYSNEANAPVSPIMPPDTKVICSEVALSKLQESIQRVRELPPCVGSICLYTFLNAHMGHCTSSVSPNHKLLSGGFSDSAIRLWSTVPSQSEPASPPDIDISRVRFACDNAPETKWNKKPLSDDFVTMRGHSGCVYKTCFYHDSRYLLSCSEDKTVRLWDLESHTNVVCYRGHNYPIWDLDIGSTSFFVTGSQDHTAKLWCTERTYPLRVFHGHSQDVDSVKLHPNQNYVATGSLDKTVRLWSAQDGRLVRIFNGHRAGVFALAFSPCGNLLASAGEDRRVKVWDLRMGELLKEFRGHTDVIYTLCFNRDSTVLASGGADGTLRVWNIEAATAKREQKETLGLFFMKSVALHYLAYTDYNLLVCAGSLT